MNNTLGKYSSFEAAISIAFGTEVSLTPTLISSPEKITLKFTN